MKENKIAEPKGSREKKEVREKKDVLTEPVVIDTTATGIFAGNEKDCKQMYLAVGAFAFAQMIKDMEGRL